MTDPSPTTSRHRTGSATIQPGLPHGPAIASTASSPVQQPGAARGSQQATGNGAALAAAERFLTETAESVHPDLAAATLLLHVARYRAHLAAMVASSRHPDRAS
jgi:hypothetical protein